MKKFLAMLAIAGVMTACNSGEDEVTEDTTTVVTEPVVVDTTTVTPMDTTVVTPVDTTVKP